MRVPYVIGVALLMIGCSSDSANPLVPTMSRAGGIQPDCIAGCVPPEEEDPSPGAPGVWLGSLFSADSCFHADAEDNDQDGIFDVCEWTVARAFAPIMRYDSNDEAGGEPYWAARPLQRRTDAMLIAYFPAYYLDLGCSSWANCNWFDDGHLGDSEALSVKVVWQSSTSHWVVDEVLLSQHEHYDTLSAFEDPPYYAPGLEYTGADGGRFLVHVAFGKHANYATRAECNAGPPWHDICNNTVGGDTLYVGLERNLGSAEHKLLDCVRSVADPYDDYEECFWTGSYFAGWNGNNAGKCYWLHLHCDPVVSDPYRQRFEDFGFIY